MSLDFTRRRETFEELLHDMDTLAEDVRLLPGGDELCGRLRGLRLRAMDAFTRMNRAIQALTSVYNISKLLDTSAGMDAILSYIVEGATDELGFDRAILYLISPDGMKLQCKYLKGFSPRGLTGHSDILSKWPDTIASRQKWPGLAVKCRSTISKTTPL